MSSINSSSSSWANICCSVTHPFKCSGQLLWQRAQTGDEIRAGAVALRESLSICLLTPPFSLCMEEAAREAAHKQQRWFTLAPSPRADHHHAELTVPPITAESDWDEGDPVEVSEGFCRGHFSECLVWKWFFSHKEITFSLRFTSRIAHNKVALIGFTFKKQNRAEDKRLKIAIFSRWEISPWILQVLRTGAWWTRTGVYALKNEILL